MDNYTQQGLRTQSSGRETIKERVYTPVEHERHYAPLNRELHAEDARQFGWVAEAGTVQSYQHQDTHRHIHIDGPSGQFYDQQKNPITRHAALNRALGEGNHLASDPSNLKKPAPQHIVEQSVVHGL